MSSTHDSPARTATSPRDEELLRRTLELAEIGRPTARPNPMVGAVLAGPDGALLAEGHHVRAGELHAERACLAAWGDRPVPPGSTMYVSLEPCAHHGRQPPCVDAILQRGIGRVVIASLDTDQRTAGIGPDQLAAAGVRVERGSEEVERLALQQNAGFHSRNLRGRPYVTAKWAMTQNGRFTSGDPADRWVSGVPAREYVHWMRAGSGAVLVGSGTVLADDPELTVRGPLASKVDSQPLRIVIDRRLRMPVTSRLARTTDLGPVLVVAAAGADPRAVRDLREAGVAVHLAPNRDRLFEDLLDELGRRGVGDLLVEAGPTLLSAMFDARLLDALTVFVSPRHAPAGEPGLAHDHPLLDHALVARAEAIGDDQCYIRVLRPAWELVRASDAMRS